MPSVKARDCDGATLGAEATIKDAIKSLNDSGLLISLVVDKDQRLLGTLTDGDIRKSLIRGGDLKSCVESICNRDPKYVHQHDSPQRVKDLCLKHSISRMPLLDDDRKPVGIYFLEDFVNGGEKITRAKTTPVVIMAGGKGTRLDPFTRILPKPLIPIGNKAVIEVIINRFYDAGFSNFIISVNYRKEFIKTYFAELEPLPYSLTFVEEEQDLDTIGSLSLMKDLLKETFLVANCDMIVDVDWDSALEFHSAKNNKTTLIGALKDFRIPYGVVMIDNEQYQGILEKPEYNFLINLGVYIFEPEVLELLEHNQPIKATDFIERAKDHGLNIGVYPIYNNWFDLGQWEEYQNTLGGFDKLKGG